MNHELAKTIGRGVRTARNALNLTVADAADQIGVGVEFYLRIEEGQLLPSILTFVKIVSELEVSADVLVGGPKMASR